MISYPVLFARASLKREGPANLFGTDAGYPVLFARASLKRAAVLAAFPASATALSRAFCAGLIEATRIDTDGICTIQGYPVLFARASLKPDRVREMSSIPSSYPVLFARASLKRGQPRQPSTGWSRYPVLFARASLKRSAVNPFGSAALLVIPCFLRGPH